MEFKATFNKLKGADGKEQNVELDDQSITNVEFEYNTIDNDVLSKASKSTITVKLTGILDAEDSDTKTLAILNDWVCVPGTKDAAYCEVKIEVIGAGQRVFREYLLPDAFVVDYREAYVDGKNSFYVEIRQKSEKLSKMVIKAGTIKAKSEN
jgi:hypothetical protein